MITIKLVAATAVFFAASALNRITLLYFGKHRPPDGVLALCGAEVELFVDAEGCVKRPLALCRARGDAVHKGLGFVATQQVGCVGQTQFKAFVKFAFSAAIFAHIERNDTLAQSRAACGGPLYQRDSHLRTV